MLSKISRPIRDTGPDRTGQAEWASDQEVRGGRSVDVEITSSDPTVGVIANNPQRFGGGGGAQRLASFDPLAVGQTTLRVVQPPGFSAPSNRNSAIIATVR